MGVFGDTLRQARAHRGVTLKEAELATRINRHHLLALEEEKFEDLPPLIYQRGIVRNYANYLDLDPNRVILLFDETRGIRPADRASVVQPQPLNMPNHWAPNFAIIAFLVVMSAVVFAWMYSAYFAPADAESTPTEIIPTVTPVNGDTLFLPSPPATLLAPTVEPTAMAEPTTAPEPTAMPEPTVATVEEVSAEDTSVVEPIEPVQEQTEEAEASLYLNFYASGPIGSLQIVADGVLIWDSGLAEGEKTGYLRAESFEVYVSDPANLQVIQEDGNAFNMGETTFFTLP
jgi:cytoskeletal protein RodZ